MQKYSINSQCKVSFQGGVLWISGFSLRKCVHASFCPNLLPQIFGKCLGMQGTGADASIESEDRVPPWKIERFMREQLEERLCRQL